MVIFHLQSYKSVKLLAIQFEKKNISCALFSLSQSIGVVKYCLHVPNTHLCWVQLGGVNYNCCWLLCCHVGENKRGRGEWRQAHKKYQFRGPALAKKGCGDKNISINYRYIFLLTAYFLKPIGITISACLVCCNYISRVTGASILRVTTVYFTV